MRVTAGELKGKLISTRHVGEASPHGELRATGAKVRQAIFNIIGPKIEGAVFADLYAGTGAVGMEAMSRGAGQVVFVEADPDRAGRIRDLLSGCGCSAKAAIHAMKADEFISRAGAKGMLFDIVYLDPPYRSEQLAGILAALGASGALGQDAVVIAEHERKEQLPDMAGVLVKKKSYKYGDTSLTLYRRADTP